MIATHKKFDELRNQDVPAGSTSSVSDGALYIPIGQLESMLDDLSWSTKNFQHLIYKDGYANLCVAASLELEISYFDQTNDIFKRTFVGACNFALSTLEPNTHFLATAKSECIKNAASDIGKYFGRGLNDNLVPSSKKPDKKVVKAKPDSKIMKQFADAIAKGDEATQIMLSNMYEIKIEPYAEEV